MEAQEGQSEKLAERVDEHLEELARREVVEEQ